MNILKLIPAILSFLLLGAHFMRVGLFPVAIMMFLFPIVLFIKQAWLVRIIQILLVIGAAEWIRTLFAYIEIRKMIGEDTTRLTIIMLSVALFTLLSAVLFQTRSLKELYKLKK